MKPFIGQSKRAFQLELQIVDPSIQKYLVKLRIMLPGLILKHPLCVQVCISEQEQTISELTTAVKELVSVSVSSAECRENLSVSDEMRLSISLGAAL